MRNSKPPGRGFTLTEVTVVVGIIIVFLALLIPQYNAYRSRLALRSAAQSVKSDYLRAVELAKQYTYIPGTSALLTPNLTVPNALAVISGGGNIIFSDPIPSNVTITSKPGFVVFGVGCKGALGVQFPGRVSGTGLNLSTFGTLLNCDGSPYLTTNPGYPPPPAPAVCGGVIFPNGVAVEVITMSDQNQNSETLCIEAPSGGTIFGPYPP